MNSPLPRGQIKQTTKNSTPLNNKNPLNCTNEGLVCLWPPLHLLKHRRIILSTSAKLEKPYFLGFPLRQQKNKKIKMPPPQKTTSAGFQLRTNTFGGGELVNQLGKAATRLTLWRHCHWMPHHRKLFAPHLREGSPIGAMSYSQQKNYIRMICVPFPPHTYRGRTWGDLIEGSLRDDEGDLIVPPHWPHTTKI